MTTQVFVQDPNVEVTREYAIAVGKTRFNELELFHCHQQTVQQTLLQHEVGDWFVYDSRAKEYTKIDPPVQTEVRRSHNSSYILEVLVPAMYVKELPHDVGFNRNVMLVSPVIGLVGAMSMPVDELPFVHGCVYKVLAVYLPDTSRALRYIRAKEKCFWGLRARYVSLISPEKLLTNQYLRHQSFMRVNFSLREQTEGEEFCYVVYDLLHNRQPIVVFTKQEKEYGDSSTVCVLPIHLGKDRIINLGVETDLTDFEFAQEISYEPVEELALSFGRTAERLEKAEKAKKQPQPPPPPPPKMDYKKALLEKPPAPKANGKAKSNGTTSKSNGTSHHSEEDDGFKTVTSKKRPTEPRVVEAKFDEELYQQPLEQPQIGRDYVGVVASCNRDARVWYLFSPELTEEIPLGMGDEGVPKDLKLTDFVKFTLKHSYSTSRNQRPFGKFVERVTPTHKVQPMTNSVMVFCNLFVPAKFNPKEGVRETQIVFTDYVRRVVDKNGVLKAKDAGKTGKCKIIRTKNTGLDDVLFVLGETIGKLNG